MASRPALETAVECNSVGDNTSSLHPIQYIFSSGGTVSFPVSSCHGTDCGGIANNVRTNQLIRCFLESLFHLHQYSLGTIKNAASASLLAVRIEQDVVREFIRGTIASCLALTLVIVQHRCRFQTTKYLFSFTPSIHVPALGIRIHGKRIGHSTRHRIVIFARLAQIFHPK